MFVWFMVWYIYYELVECLLGICFVVFVKLILNVCWLYKNKYKKVIFILINKKKLIDGNWLYWYVNNFNCWVI